MLSAKELRSTYLPDNYHIEELFERWRHQGEPGWTKGLTPEEVQAVWLHISDTVLNVAKCHFGQRQSYRFRKNISREWWELDTKHPYYDVHMERMLQLVGLLRTYMHKSPSWCFKVHRRRFAQLEAVRELREVGVAVPNEQCADVHHWVNINRLKREAMKRFGDDSLPFVLNVWREEDGWTEKKEENFLERWWHYNTIKRVGRPLPYEGYFCGVEYLTPDDKDYFNLP